LLVKTCGYCFLNNINDFFKSLNFPDIVSSTISRVS